MEKMFPDSGVGASQNFVKVEYFFTAAAAGTPWTIAPWQKSAADKCWMVTGDGAIDITAAEANAIIQQPDYSAQKLRDVNLSAAIVTKLTNVAAAADAALVYGFAFGGLRATDCMRIEIAITPTLTTALSVNTHVIKQTSITKLADSVLDTSPVVVTGSNVFVAQGNIFGLAAITDVLNVPAAGDLVTVTLWIKQ